MRTIMPILTTLVLAQTGFGSDQPQVAEAKQEIPKVVAPSIQKALHPMAYRITRGDKDIAFFWIRVNVPTSSTKELVAYDKVATGTLVGVLQVVASEQLSDFRDQPLPAGVYTLRIATHPQDGNHMGVATSPEFLCLAPARADADLAPIPHDDLMKLSIDSIGTGHPGVLFLHPYSQLPKEKAPHLHVNSEQHVILGLVTKATLKDAKAVDFPIGIVIVGASHDA